MLLGLWQGLAAWWGNTASNVSRCQLRCHCTQEPGSAVGLRGHPLIPENGHEPASPASNPTQARLGKTRGKSLVCTHLANLYDVLPGRIKRYMTFIMWLESKVKCILIVSILFQSSLYCSLGTCCNGEDLRSWSSHEEEILWQCPPISLAQTSKWSTLGSCQVLKLGQQQTDIIQYKTISSSCRERKWNDWKKRVFF